MSRPRHPDVTPPPKAPKQKPRPQAGADAGDTPAVIDAAQVAAYLAANPGFLSQNAELLDAIEPPARHFTDAEDRVVDFQNHLLRHERSRLRDTEQRHQRLVATSRGNMHTLARIHDAVLAIMAARSVDHLLEIVTVDSAVILGVDIIALGIEDSQVNTTTNEGVRVLPAGTVDRVMGPGRRVLLHGNTPPTDDWTADKALFGSATGLVQSHAVVRLTIGQAPPPALLAIGSRDPAMLAAGQATEPFAFLGRVLEQSFRSWLDLPPRRG